MYTSNETKMSCRERQGASQQDNGSSQEKANYNDDRGLVRLLLTVVCVSLQPSAL